MRFLVLIALCMGCGMNAKVRRLSPEETDRYHALKVWMSEDERKDYLHGKTEADRDAWLASHALWDRFYQYDDAIRGAIVAGDVAVGFRQDAVFMAWGEPYSRLKSVGRQVERSEQLLYRFEIDKKGNTVVWHPDSHATYKAVDFYEVRLTVDNQVVTALEELPGWNSD